MPDSDAGPPLLATEGACSTIEAAQHLGTSVQTVQRWLDRGYLRGWRTPGGHRRIDVASVHEVLERARPTVAAPGQEPAAIAAKRVMIVDDSSDDLELLAAVVMAVLPHFQQILMHNGFAALAAMGENPPDLLLTDIAMPGIDGVEMIRSLREVPRLERLPVIAVSSFTAKELALKFGTLPAHLLTLLKPVTPSMLRAALAGVFAPQTAA